MSGLKCTVRSKIHTRKSTETNCAVGTVRLRGKVVSIDNCYTVLAMHQPRDRADYKTTTSSTTASGKLLTCNMKSSETFQH